MAARTKKRANRPARSSRGSKTQTSRRKAQKPKPKSTWGGRRPGAGRPVGSGSGPSPNSRKNRVAVMFTDTELAKLKALAKKRKLPIATVAHRLIERFLKRG